MSNPITTTEFTASTAKRRAGKALDDIAYEVTILRRKLDQDSEVDGDDTHIIADRVRQLTGHLATLGTLSDVLDAMKA